MSITMLQRFNFFRHIVLQFLLFQGQTAFLERP